jgi:F plasmid transfer operon protein
MPERVALVLVVAAAFTLLVLFVRQLNARRLKVLQQRGPAWDRLDLQPDGRPTLIAFSTASCAACHQAQAPAIDLARKQLGGEQAVRVINIDAAQQPHAARAFGILTVPSTVVVAAEGRQIVAVNQGFASSARLLQQLQRS